MENFLEILRKIYEENREEIKRRLEVFEENRNFLKEERFLELCFCILVAGNSIERTLKIWNEIGKGFLFLNEIELKEKLRNLGYRFYNIRSKYIVKNREKINILEKLNCDEKSRELLVKNFYGIGYKEASHFLRNIGCKNFAIIDRHVLNFLRKFNLIKIPKNISKKKYLEIENILKDIAKKLKISLAELDFCIFYYETKKFCEK